MRRRIGIAQSLLGDPGLLVADEPTAGLDPEARMRFRSLLAHIGQERTVVLATHILGDVSHLCSSVIVLSAGRPRFHGTVREMTGVARGRTYEMPVGVPVGGQAVVVGASPECYRVVTPEAPSGGRPVPPTLEDGYIALMRLGAE
ncbi:P-loop NTPase family protein [Nocardiopsis salina]|uniref:hypothetical protein n=1 Tax=Nocardiopsis salina TaxID=245836 RepID=UPI00035E738C